jgi:RNA polymerase sigma-54 factor
VNLRTAQQFKFRPSVTVHLAQTMTFLQLSTAELEDTLTAELANNPALEIVTNGRCLNCGRRLRGSSCLLCDRPPAGSNDPIVSLAARTSQHVDDAARETAELAAPEPLAEYILRQIAPAMSTSDRPVAIYLLNRLDEHGFLLETPAEISEILQIPSGRVTAVLNLIQRADPPGIGARDVPESLLLQLESLEGNGQPNNLVRTMIADHWAELGQHDLKHLTRELLVSFSEIEAAILYIRRNLTPYPAQAYWGSRRGPSSAYTATYQEPDALIHGPTNGPDGPLTIEVFSPVAGWLCVNTALKTAIHECRENEREQLQQSIERAQMIIRCVQQRNRTLCRLLEVIAREQRGFILGRQSDLRPLTRARLAEQLGLHESTMSRAVADKMVALPGGHVVPLAQFFDQSLVVRQALKSIVATEEKPLSDDEIAQRLSLQGFSVARRTVAKYRAIEGIPSAVERARIKRARK